MKRILLLGLIFFAGCSLFVTKPEIAVKSVELTGIDRSGIGMVFLIAVTNPNSYDVKLTGYNYDLSVSDLPLAKGENRDIVEFRGNSTTDVRLPVTVAFHDLLEILKRRPDPEKIPYQLTAGFDLHTPFGTLNVPVRKSGIFTVPQKYRSGLIMNLFK